MIRIGFRADMQDIDPDLSHFTGSQYATEGKVNFGLFLDSSPDRWGRMLMQRKRKLSEKTQEFAKKRLIETDYLLGVHDKTRMGALRFKTSKDGQSLAESGLADVPPFAHIRELEHATLKVENEHFFDDREAAKWLDILLVPGSSLGGARPKACVRDIDSYIWIAKFPSTSDTKDSGAWEYLVNQQAKELGINVATAESKIFSQKRHTFITRRFDRTDKNNRIHYASALSLLSLKDGHDHKDGGSYLELVELLERYGYNPDNDIRELWRRIVFSVAVSSSDDHLRNHGFLLGSKGWFLSPAYDINPNEHGTGLSLNISEDDNSLGYDLCMSVSAYFRYKFDEAKSFIKLTKKTIGHWHKKAAQMKISKAEQVMMESAFNV